jgi:HSP20 family protein
MADSTTAQAATQPTAPVKEPTALKPVPKGDLSDPITKIYNSIAKRAFEIFEENGSIFGSDLDNWLQAESELLHPAHINITDTGDSLNVSAEVPGYTAKDLEVSVEPECLTITGKREMKEEREKEGKPVYSECCADEILRVIELPAAVDTTKVTATLKDGVLELQMPKAAPPKKITVEAKAA